ncbi:hypothetical protein [Streptomyces asiaticus]|uniref:hypothetical protein n=1 Tax=Streptomyces asiaticus TaxID=114695 RepID=UPI003F676427
MRATDPGGKDGDRAPDVVHRLPQPGRHSAGLRGVLAGMVAMYFLGRALWTADDHAAIEIGETLAGEGTGRPEFHDPETRA